MAFWVVKNSDEIIKKINSYAHTEHNIPKFNNKNYIEECIKNVSFLNNRDELYLSDKLNFLPKYILNNLDRFREWIKEK